MADGASESRRMTTAEFLEWESRQPHRHEFIAGEVRMMAGGTKAHARIAGNVNVALRLALRGAPCQPFGSDLQVQVADGHVYYPDVTVDCAPWAGEATKAGDPRLVAEVHSKSTRDSDFADKLPQYQALNSLQEILFIEADRMEATLWRRQGGVWAPSTFVDPAETLPWTASAQP